MPTRNQRPHNVLQLEHDARVFARGFGIPAKRTLCSIAMPVRPETLTLVDLRHWPSPRLTLVLSSRDASAETVPLSPFREALRGRVAHSAGRRRQPGPRVQSVGATPLFIVRGRGAQIEDADGRKYIDYVMSWGPLIHGHAPKGLLKALAETARAARASARPTELETRLAQRVAMLMPSIERVRFVSSGTEAAMSALRVARAATRRDKIIKFEGCYHGHADPFLVQAGSGATTLGVPTSPGVPAAAAADTLIARYNDLDSVRNVAGAASAGRSRRCSSSRSRETWDSSLRVTASCRA